MFKKDVVQVETYKTPLLALFSFLKIDRENAFRVVQLLEGIDPDLMGIVSMKDFALRYCKSNVTPLLVIYFHYATASKNCADKREGYTSVKQFARAKQTNEEIAAHFHQIIDNCSYFDLICFVLHFLTIPDSRIVEFMFWMAFVGQQKTISQEELLSLFDSLYSEQLAKEVPFVMKCRKKIEDLCKTVDMDGLTAYRLQIFDIRTGGLYTKAMLGVKREIVASTFGKAFWRKITDGFHHVIAHLEENYDSLEKIPFHRQHVWNEFVINAERKQARKQIRRFIRVMLDFRKMETAEKEESAKGFRMEGSVLKFFSNVLRVFPSRSRSGFATVNAISTFNNTSLAAKVFESLFGKKGDDEMMALMENEDEVIPLEERYKEALDQTIEEIISDSKYWETDARLMLRDCDELLKSAASMLESDVKDTASVGSAHSRESNATNTKAMWMTSAKSRTSGKSTKSLSANRDQQRSMKIVKNEPRIDEEDELTRQHEEQGEDEDDNGGAPAADGGDDGDDDGGGNDDDDDDDGGGDEGKDRSGDGNDAREDINDDRNSPS